MIRLASIAAMIGALYAISCASAIDAPATEAKSGDPVGVSPSKSIDFSSMKTVIRCPDERGALVQVEHNFEIDQPDRFTCWYAPSDEKISGYKNIYPYNINFEGRCDLLNVDIFADYRGKGKGFVGGNHTCRGDAERCRISCQTSPSK